MHGRRGWLLGIRGQLMHARYATESADSDTGQFMRTVTDRQRWDGAHMTGGSIRVVETGQLY
ncbi:hypothetical protein B0H19DRAFT_1183680 [Mycena capillaripes]|nr:hypothetical protein B0H19DRAFT_1183680 [Mycena capillaripes]